MTGVGCMCGWPLDRCNPKFANGTRCGKREFAKTGPLRPCPAVPPQRLERR